MGENNIFKGRTIAVIDDLSLDERRYIFQKTRELKDAVGDKNKRLMDEFRINDLDFGIYEVFIEDSTRTEESFKNAADFLRVKHNELNVEMSSFNKKESYANAFNTLIGYYNNICIIRSKLEGAPRWLEIAGKAFAERHGRPMPSFINGGDGAHEHPTQEILDDFSFLEDNNWDYSHIHVALLGDLLLGRTVHSKPNGLKIFNSVEADVIAPEVLQMPDHYIDRMKANGFEVRIFESIEEYLSQKNIAPQWYFTRFQSERHSEEVKKMVEQLREKITYEKRFLDKTPEGTKFYHPQPFDKESPTIPDWVKTLPLNYFEKQSINGYFTRIVELSLIGGQIGHDFKGEPKQPTVFEEDFIQEIDLEGRIVDEKKDPDIKPIANGVNIDHICKGDTRENITRHIYFILRVLGLDKELHFAGPGESKKDHKDKGYISVPNIPELSFKAIKKLAALAPGSTVNTIKDNEVVKKLKLDMPPRIYGFDELACDNKDCISHPSYNESVIPEFHREGDKFVCMYCEKPHFYKQIWAA
jgi:aspartate carbamoyltransferase